MRDGRPKYLLRKLLARQMGAEFADRKKHGFRLPEVSWFRGLPRARLEEHLRSDGIEEWLDWGTSHRFVPARLASRSGVLLAVHGIFGLAPITTRRIEDEF